MRPPRCVQTVEGLAEELLGEASVEWDGSNWAQIAATGTLPAARSLPAMGYDANRRPFGVSAEVTAAMRRDLSAKFAKSFDAQGIATRGTTPEEFARFIAAELARWRTVAERLQP